MKAAPKPPSFLYIGPDKTGSTWLYELLAAHPRCYVPEAKDIYFFDRYYDRGMQWYLSFFANAPADVLARGEISHDYLFSPSTAERIHKHLPAVTLLTSLRHPVDRTFSHYLYLIRSGLTSAPFEAALDDFPELLNQSRYERHLQAYLDLFPRRQLRILLFEDLVADARSYAQTICEALGIDFLESLPYQQSVLPASRPRNRWLARAAKLGATAARDIGLANLVGRVKRGRMLDLLYQPYEQGKQPRMAPQTRQRLVETFAPTVEAVETLIERDLEDWRR